MSYTGETNLLGGGNVYDRYYGDFRGVDFSSDHTQVHDQRLAYLVNMYKDYQSGEGRALETIVGFRRRVDLPGDDEVYGIHHFQHKDSDGKIATKILLHAGSRLYLWHNYPNSINVEAQMTVTLPKESENINGTKEFKITLQENIADVTGVAKLDGEAITSFKFKAPNCFIWAGNLNAGDTVHLSYIKDKMEVKDALFNDMNARRSTSFVFNNRLYLIDGKNYLVYDGETICSVLDEAYIPTTYKNIIPSGENADAGAEYEQRNILNPRFKHTFFGNGDATEFYMNERDLEAVTEVRVYDKVQTESEYTVDLANGKITFNTAPKKPEEEGYPEDHAGIEITAKKTIKRVSGVTAENIDVSEIGNLITSCTIAATFDNRIFLSGNPNYPNHIFYCGRNITGYIDPSYFGVPNHKQDGVGIAPITGMIPVADTLMVLKSDTHQESSTYFHTAVETGEDLAPVIYPSTPGHAGVGCLGACTNFLDDPIFISHLGVEAVGQLSVRNERAIEHRSSLVDAKLVNTDLQNAVVEEWNGYLCILVDGKIFMADSRQKYTHSTGVPQYEWYYLEDIGVYQGQYPEYRYASEIDPVLENVSVRYCKKCKCAEGGCKCGNNENVVELPLSLAKDVYFWKTDETLSLLGEVANPPDESGEQTGHVCNEIVSVKSDDFQYNVSVYYKVHELCDSFGNFLEYKALLCQAKGNKTGGVFKRATVLRSFDGNLFFGTKNGVICSFNFDMRDDHGEFAPRYYAFDDRTIYCGCATKMDCCGIPHLNKNTVKKSTVVKTRSFQSSAAKIKVRTNRKPYEQIARIYSTLFSFDGMDFSDFSFVTTEQSLFAIKEKEKKWVEKQYYIYSDEYTKPFALFYITFRYTVSGRYKD